MKFCSVDVIIITKYRYGKRPKAHPSSRAVMRGEGGLRAVVFTLLRYPDSNDIRIDAQII